MVLDILANDVSISQVGGGKKVKKQFLLVILSVMLFTLSACYYPGTVAETGLFAPYCILESDAPFADNLHTIRWDQVKLLDQDSYGRQYFSYTTPSRSFNCELEIHVICQSATEDQQYGYYEDYCYIVRKETANPFTEEEISNFKIRNEWDLPLDPEKTSLTSRAECNDWIVGMQELSDNLVHYLGFENAYVVVNGMERISESAQIFLAYVISEDIPEQEERGAYLVLYQSNTSSPILMCQKIDVVEDCQDIVSDFRRNALNTLLDSLKNWHKKAENNQR